MINHSEDAFEERPDDIDLCILLKKNYQVDKNFYNFEPEVREGGNVEQKIETEIKTRLDDIFAGNFSPTNEPKVSGNKLLQMQLKPKLSDN